MATKEQAPTHSDIEEIVAAIQASLDDMNAGHIGRDADEFLQELRDEFNLLETS